MREGGENAAQRHVDEQEESDRDQDPADQDASEAAQAEAQVGHLLVAPAQEPPDDDKRDGRFGSLAEQEIFDAGRDRAEPQLLGG